jgi:hypothetical protein
MHLAVVNEEGEFTRLGEVGLSGKESDSRQAVVASARHSSGGDRQKCSSQAVSGRMDLAVRDDGVDRGERGHDVGPVIGHGEVAIFGAWIAPGDTEDGVALSDQIPDERVLRRQIDPAGG